jgi:hypothetical protein
MKNALIFSLNRRILGIALSEKFTFVDRRPCFFPFVTEGAPAFEVHHQVEHEHRVPGVQAPIHDVFRKSLRADYAKNLIRVPFLQ